MTRILWAWGPATAWAAVIFCLSAATWADAPSLVEVNDTVVHFGIFTVFGATLAHAGRGNEGRTEHAFLIALGLLYALSDELHQSFVPGRTPSFGDLVADSLGIASGYGGFLRVAARRRGPKEKGLKTND